MSNLSYINTGVKSDQTQSYNVPTDESVGGMLFDISGFSNPFDGYPLLYSNFKNGAVKRIYNMDDAELLGIVNDGFMNGLLYYHISQFYNYIGGNQELYIAIYDCSNDWGILSLMQLQTVGRMFQIGVWTSQPIWSKNVDGSIGFTSLIGSVQAEADEICGKIGKSTDKATPLNIILCPNINYIDGIEVNYKKLPDASILNCPKVSVVMAQNGSDEIHNIQKKMPNNSPVSSLGFMMACLAICGAEESIASLQRCDLNKGEQFNYPELGIGKTYTPISEVNRLWANTLSSKGYIIPIDYDGLEASYFFSSDQTLSDGDYSSLANNRVMHKCRRAVCTVLYPYVNSHHIYDSVTKTINATSISIITDSINTILDSVMKNKYGNEQIGGRSVEFLKESDILETDSISLRLSINPINYSGFIEEKVHHDTTN